MNGSVGRCTFFMLATVAILVGCTYRPPASPYSSHYQSRLASVSLPDTETIQSVGTAWTFVKPPDEVWTALLRVVSQYEGILRLDRDAGSYRQLVFVHGQAMPLQTPSWGFHQNKNMAFSKFLDTWIAVVVSSEDGGQRTAVAAAWISPATGQVASADVSRPDQQAIVDLSQGISAAPSHVPHARITQSFATIASALSEDRIQIAAKFTETEGQPLKRWDLVPQATINEFFYHLATQLYGPARWQDKFGGEHTAKNQPVKVLDELTRNTDYDAYATEERELGNWTSATLRRSVPTVDSPPMETLLQDIVDRLKAAAGEHDRQIKAYIIISPQINAFTLPNGDIFICSGLLEALDSVDEVAAVLGHELDHLFQHDTTARLTSLRTSRAVTTTLMGIAALAGPLAGVAAAGGAAATAVASTSMSTTSSMISNVVATSVQLAGGILGQSIGMAIVSGHSQEAELRADAQGARYLWAAGYDVEANLRMLESLQERKAQAERRQEPIASGFLNAQPGLEKRTEAMRAVLGKPVRP